jgi:LmbE family N-acetylglucosaminyl deacetylase
MRDKNSRRVLVIAAHPDDEVLGCGGTIALHADAGDPVTVLIACEGESLRYGTGNADQDKHTQQAAEILGVQDVRLLKFPDQRLDTLSLPEVIAPLEKALEDTRPHVVYCQYGGDVNQDHHLLFRAALVATRPVRDHLRTVLAFDTASSTEWAYPRTFNPDTWVDISRTLQRKLDAMACYQSEVCQYPHPRSLEALRVRAANWGSQVAAVAAEVFMTVRTVFRNGETPI